MIEPEIQKLVDAARAARDCSLSPFSNFCVGAAVETEDGKIYTGCNIESASYGLTVCAERGRTIDSVIEQYLATVRPMHQQFVEPSKRYADVIIPEGGHNVVSIDLLSGKIRERLASALTTSGGQA